MVEYRRWIESLEVLTGEGLTGINVRAEYNERTGELKIILTKAK